MTRPTSSPAFATDATFTSGALTGSAPRLDPGAGFKAQGWYPNRRVPARWFNWLLGIVGDWLGYLDEIQLNQAVQEWRGEILPGDFGSRDVIFRFLATPRFNSTLAGEAVVALGQQNGGGEADDVFPVVSAGSLAPLGLIDIGTGDLGACAAGGAPGEYLIGTAGGVTAVRNLGLAGNADASGYTSSFTPCAVHYMRGPGVYLAANASDGSFDRCVGPLATAAPFTQVATALATSFATGSIGTPGGEFADNGANAVVFLASAVVGGVTRFRAFASTDAGDTWTETKTFGAGITSAALTYSKFHGCFVIVDSDGETWTSPSGGIWTSRGVKAELAAPFYARHGVLASAGPCIAKLFRAAVTGGTNYVSGVAYSFDLGLTWRTALFEQHDPALAENYTLQSLVAANGRFYAVGHRRLFQSGILYQAAADF